MKLAYGLGYAPLGDVGELKGWPPPNPAPNAAPPAALASRSTLRPPSEATTEPRRETPPVETKRSRPWATLSAGMVLGAAFVLLGVAYRDGVFE